MKMVKLRGRDDRPERPWRDLHGNECLVYEPRVAVRGYSLVAERAAQSKSGLTHLASLCEKNGVVDVDPMTDCGLNSGSRPRPMKWVNGPVLITCKRCTINGFLRLCCEGKLPR